MCGFDLVENGYNFVFVAILEFDITPLWKTLRHGTRNR